MDPTRNPRLLHGPLPMPTDKGASPRKAASPCTAAWEYLHRLERECPALHPARSGIAPGIRGSATVNTTSMSGLSRRFRILREKPSAPDLACRNPSIPSLIGPLT